MADSIWPAGLPQHPLIRRARLNPEVWKLRTQMDAGPAKVRRRRTISIDRWSMSMVLTSAQLTTFRTFFHDTIQQGSAAFDWVDPIDGTTDREARFLESYSVEPIDARAKWEVSFEVEFLPIAVPGVTPPAPGDPPGGGHDFLRGGDPFAMLGEEAFDFLEEAIVQPLIAEADSAPPNLNVVLFSNIGGGFDGFVPAEDEGSSFEPIPYADIAPPGTVVQLENMAVGEGVS